MLEDLVMELATAYRELNDILIERAFREFKLCGIERNDAIKLMYDALRK